MAFVFDLSEVTHLAGVPVVAAAVEALARHLVLLVRGFSHHVRHFFGITTPVLHRFFEHVLVHHLERAPVHLPRARDREVDDRGAPSKPHFESDFELRSSHVQFAALSCRN